MDLFNMNKFNKLEFYYIIFIDNKILFMYSINPSNKF